MRATLLLFLAILASAQTKLPPPATVKVDFEKDVQPILAQKCHSCHGEDAQQSGLRLDMRQNALRGGDYGPVIIPGKSEESKLIRRLVGGDGHLDVALAPGSEAGAAIAPSPPLKLLLQINSCSSCVASPVPAGRRLEKRNSSPD